MKALKALKVAFDKSAQYPNKKFEGEWTLAATYKGFDIWLMKWADMEKWDVAITEPGGDPADRETRRAYDGVYATKQAQAAILVQEAEDAIDRYLKTDEGRKDPIANR